MACPPGVHDAACFPIDTLSAGPTGAPAAVAFSALLSLARVASPASFRLHSSNILSISSCRAPPLHGTCVLKLSNATQCSALHDLFSYPASSVVCPKPPTGPVVRPFSSPPLTAASRASCARLVPLPHVLTVPLAACYPDALPRFLPAQTVRRRRQLWGAWPWSLSLPTARSPDACAPSPQALAHPAALAKSLVFCLFRLPGSCAWCGCWLAGYSL